MTFSNTHNGDLRVKKNAIDGSPEGWNFQILDADRELVETITTGEDGYAASGKLELGTYYVVEIHDRDETYWTHDAVVEKQVTVTEIRTDNGYTLLKDNIKIVISQVEATELCDIYSSDLLGLVQNDPRYAAIIKDTGNLKNMPQPHLEHHLLTASATVDSKDVNMLDDDGSANAIVPLKVINTRGFDLPQTGDSGTMAFSIIGILLMACAAVVIVMVFRKKCNSN